MEHLGLLFLSLLRKLLSFVFPIFAWFDSTKEDFQLKTDSDIDSERTHMAHIYLSLKDVSERSDR